MNDLKRNLMHIMCYRGQLNSEGFCDLMSKILSNHPHISWELGEHPEERCCDVLSLSVKNNLPEMNLIKNKLSLPIKKDDWTIDVGIPPRSWELYFELSCGDKSLSYNIDGRAWMWLADFKDGSCKLKLYVPQINSINAGYIKDIVNIVLIGEIGELNMLTYIDKVIVSAVYTDDFRSMEEFKYEFIRQFPGAFYSRYLSEKEQQQ